MCKVSGLMSRRFSILFGARLRVVRISRGMGLDEFSALLGISKQDLRRYEWGRRCLRLTAVWDFSQKLGVPLHVLGSGRISFAKRQRDMVCRCLVE